MVSTTRTFIGALLMCCAIISGCGTLIPGPATTTTTLTSPTPSLPPAEEAQDVIDYFHGYFDFRLPAAAQRIRVAKPPLQDFRASAVISFTAPRDQVITQVCESVGAQVNSLPRLLTVYPVKSMLDFADITMDTNDYDSCDRYVKGRQIIVRIPKADNGTTYVILYHLPYR